MFSKIPGDRLRRSIAVRLSVWFVTLFAIGFSAIFGSSSMIRMRMNL